MAGGDDRHSPIEPSLAWVDEPSSRSKGRDRWLWLVFGALAIFAFEVTSDPALAVAVGCLKLLVNEYRDARRERRAQDDPVVGLVQGRFRMVWGVWKVSGWALFVMFAVLCLHQAIRDFEGKPPADDVPREFVSASLIAIGGACLASLLTVRAAAMALRRGVKVWLGDGRNRVGDVMTIGMIIPMVVASLPVYLPPFLGLPPDHPATPQIFAAVFMGYFFLVLPFGLLWLRDFLTTRIAARWPGEAYRDGSRD